MKSDRETNTVVILLLKSGLCTPLTKLRLEDRALDAAEKAALFLRLAKEVTVGEYLLDY